MPVCGKCGGRVDVRYAYWKGDEARHRICPRRGSGPLGRAKTVRVRANRDIAATVARGFLDPRSYVAADGREILYDQDWQLRVKEVFERDGYMCHWKIETVEPSRESFDGVAMYRSVICGRPAEHPHHVIRRSIRHDDRASNLIAICAEHHREAHPEKQTRFTKRRAR